MRGLYRGASSLFVGQAGVIGVEFFIYEWAKRHIFHSLGDRQGPYHPDRLDMWEVFLAGAVCGWFGSFIWCPVEYVKIQKQQSNGLASSRRAPDNLLRTHS